MKSFTITALLSGTALAQTYTQSKPFTLHATGGKYKDAPLSACHEGAAIEGLCVGYGGSEYALNTTSGQTGAPNAGTPGVLTYSLPVTGPNNQPGNISEGMNFYYSPNTDVALPLFEPAYPNVRVSFDQNQRMNVQTNVDDTVTPPKAEQPVPLYRWYVCQTYYSGYTYTTLAWKMGSGKPQNPSCVYVDVKRKFV